MEGEDGRGRGRDGEVVAGSGLGRREDAVLEALRSVRNEGRK